MMLLIDLFNSIQLRKLSIAYLGMIMKMLKSLPVTFFVFLHMKVQTKTIKYQLVSTFFIKN